MIPAAAGLYEPLVDHPNVFKVIVLSGGFGRNEALRRTEENRGMIASFSRALLCDLRAGRTDAKFDAALESTMGDIREASVNKVHFRMGRIH